MNRRTDISMGRTVGTFDRQPRRAAASPGSVHQCYSYGYDGLNRLVSAAYSAGSDGIMPMTTAEYVALNDRDYSCMYGYDVNGNVTSLRRKGVASAVDDGGDNIYITYGDIDDLSLTYDGNRLSKVSDAADALTYAGAMDFRDGADVSVEYTYDANGNMTSDLNKGISLIRYNVLNLPGYVQFADGHSVTYTYDADGNKLRTVSGANVIAVLPDLENSPVTQAALDDVGQITEPVTVLSTREYCGGHVYADGRLERTLQPWGYTGADGADYFYITDYLGNVRTVTDRHGYACELNAYYPYGALMNTLSGNGTRQPYKYGGKELDRTAGLDLYDSQARFYDAVLGRTTTVDPKSAAYAGTSHYAWCAGNPTRYVDPDGRDWLLSTGDRLYWYGGNYGDKSDLKDSYKATSGSKSLVDSKDKNQNYQNSKYQYVRSKGPTVEGKYKLNIAPEPETAKIKNKVIENGRGKGIQSLKNMPDENGRLHESASWGANRINLIPINVSQPKDLNGKTHIRDLGSFYIHDSTKGETQGCIEVESRFFIDLLEFRTAGNKLIFVKVKYPNSDHNTNGGTEK